MTCGLSYKAWNNLEGHLSCLLYVHRSQYGDLIVDVVLKEVDFYSLFKSAPI